MISFDAGRGHGDGHGLHADHRGGQTEEFLDANLGYLARNCSNPDQSVQTGSIQIESHVDGALSEADIQVAQNRLLPTTAFGQKPQISRGKF